MLLLRLTSNRREGCLKNWIPPNCDCSLRDIHRMSRFSFTTSRSRGHGRPRFFYHPSLLNAIILYGDILSGVSFFLLPPICHLSTKQAFSVDNPWKNDQLSTKTPSFMDSSSKNWHHPWKGLFSRMIYLNQHSIHKNTLFRGQDRYNSCPLRALR